MTGFGNDVGIGKYTREEILAQSESWQAALKALIDGRHAIADLFRRVEPKSVLFTGCGSPYYACLSAAEVYRERVRGVASAAPASEIAFGPDGLLPEAARALVVAVSRSGETTELLDACRRMKTAGARVLGVTIAGDSPLARLSDVALVLPAAAERSLAQTRSFSAMLLATIGLIAVGLDDGPLLGDLKVATERAPRLVAEADRIAAHLVQRPFGRIFFLGSGARYGLAQEGAMKLMEMSLTDSSAFHFLEFRHGPQTMVDPTCLVVGLLSTGAPQAEMAVLGEMRELGATILAVGGTGRMAADQHFVSIAADDLSGGPAGLLQSVPILQWLGLHQALRKGVDPDVPRHLTRFVDLSGRSYA